jgi:hypothetical protein
MPTDAPPLARKLKLPAASRPIVLSKIQTDLTRDAGWESVTAADLMWLGLVSIDATWSAFSLRHYRSGEARQAFR